jgi:hypothetical protein
MIERIYGKRIPGGSLFSTLALGAAIATLALAGCKSNPNPADATTTANDPNAQDPTLVNMAPVDNSSTAAPQSAPAQGPTQVAGYQQQAQPTQQSYSNPAPIERRAASSDSDGQYSDQGASPGYSNDDYDAETGYNATLSDLSAPQPPPPLPTYEQPEAPEPGYIWTPGYWSYTPQGYYWVPGAWTQPPYTGALWTPGYWGGYGNGYRFHHGFWAAHIGFYGGINYGFGYVGVGYQGGYWNGPHFFYNQYANHINININPGFRDAVYQRNVVVNNTVISNRVVNNTTINNVTINNRTINNVSYNGGQGGIQARPRPAELAVLREQRVPPMQAQVQQQKVAATNPQQFYARNQGRPAEAAVARPLVADRGIAAPEHTTAQINRALPVSEQIRQERQFVRPATPSPGARLANQPNPVESNRVAPNQPQNRPAIANQPNRPGQPENRPNQPQAERRPTPQQAERPVVPQARPAPQQQRAIPQQSVRPQPVRPQPEERSRTEAQPAHPQPEARPQAEQPRPQPKVQQQPRPQARPAPAPHPQARPEQSHEKPHEEPHEHR